MRRGEDVGYWSYDENFFTHRTDWHERLSNDTLHWTWLSRRHWNHSAEAVFWMGPAGASTGLHYDDDSMAVLHQFVGEKRVWLYPPECTPYLYPEEECSENEQGSGGRYACLFNCSNPCCVLFHRNSVLNDQQSFAQRR